MDWCLVSTIYAASFLLLGCQISISSPSLTITSQASQPFVLANRAIALQSSLVNSSSNDVFGYKPPRDIGKPRRTGPSGGRIA